MACRLDGCQAIIWTNALILLIGTSGTNSSEILIEIHTLSFKKMHLKMSSGKWQPFCHGRNVLNWNVKCSTTPTLLITYPFPNFNGCAIEVWEWTSNYLVEASMNLPDPQDVTSSHRTFLFCITPPQCCGVYPWVGCIRPKTQTVTENQQMADVAVIWKYNFQTLSTK